MPHLEWLRRIAGILILIAAVLTAGSHRGSSWALADDSTDEEPAEEADPAEVAAGERLFLETRFAQHFFALSGAVPQHSQPGAAGPDRSRRVERVREPRSAASPAPPADAAVRAILLRARRGP